MGARAPTPVLALPNQRWSLDFVHDQLATGRRFRILNVVDDVTRGCLRPVGDTSISGRRALRALSPSGRTALHGPLPNLLRDRANLERGARLVGRYRDRVALHHPGKATQNGFVESFNGRMRDEFLNETLFFTIGQARSILARWVYDYNTERPHAWLRHSGGLRRRTRKATGGFNPARCFARAYARLRPSVSGFGWMKVGFHVSGWDARETGTIRPSAAQ